MWKVLQFGMKTMPWVNITSCSTHTIPSEWPTKDRDVTKKYYTNLKYRIHILQRNTWQLKCIYMYLPSHCKVHLWELLAPSRKVTPPLVTSRCAQTWISERVAGREGTTINEWLTFRHCYKLSITASIYRNFNHGEVYTSAFHHTVFHSDFLLELLEHLITGGESERNTRFWTIDQNIVFPVPKCLNIYIFK